MGRPIVLNLGDAGQVEQPIMGAIPCFEANYLHDQCKKVSTQCKKALNPEILTGVENSNRLTL